MKMKVIYKKQIKTNNSFQIDLYIKMILTYKIPNHAEYPDAIKALYQFFIQGNVCK